MSLIQRLRSYRPADEWGDPVHHVMMKRPMKLSGHEDWR